MKHILFFAAVFVILASCKKNHTDIPAESTPLIKNYKVNATGATVTLQYDANGRLTLTSNDINLSRSTYTYSPGQCKEDLYDNAGVFQYSRIYKLDANGLAFEINYTGSTDTVFRTFTAGQLELVNTTSFHGNRYTIYNYYTGDRLDSSTSTYPNGVTNNKTYYEYYPGITNTIGPVNKGMVFLGKLSPRALKKSTNLNYDQAGVYQGASIIDYTYETDAKGRITKAVSTGGSSSSLSYTYTN